MQSITPQLQHFLIGALFSTQDHSISVTHQKVVYCSDEWHPTSSKQRITELHRVLSGDLTQPREQKLHVPCRGNTCWEVLLPRTEYSRTHRVDGTWRKLDNRLLSLWARTTIVIQEWFPVQCELVGESGCWRKWFIFLVLCCWWPRFYIVCSQVSSFAQGKAEGLVPFTEPPKYATKSQRPVNQCIHSTQEVFRESGGTLAS